MLVAGGIILLTAGVVAGGYYLIYKTPVLIGTDPDKVKGYDAKIMALINKMNTYSAVEREARIRAKLSSDADKFKVLALLSQYNTSRASMTEVEKQQLYQMMNLVYNT